MILAFGGQKGGVGKSTLATSIAAELLRRGSSVLLVDGDEQGTATTWVEVAREAGKAVPEFVQLGDDMHQRLPALAAKVEHTLIDLPSRLGTRQKAAFVAADAVLLACGPSAADMWALTESVDLVLAARAMRPKLRGYVVINRTQKFTTAGKSLRDDLRKWRLEVLFSQLTQRVAYRDALAAGVGVTTLAGAGEAKSEVTQLVDELLDRMASDGEHEEEDE